MMRMSSFQAASHRPDLRRARTLNTGCPKPRSPQRMPGPPEPLGDQSLHCRFHHAAAGAREAARPVFGTVHSALLFAEVLHPPARSPSCPGASVSSGTVNAIPAHCPELVVRRRLPRAPESPRAGPPRNPRHRRRSAPSSDARPQGRNRGSAWRWGTLPNTSAIGSSSIATGL